MAKDQPTNVWEDIVEYIPIYMTAAPIDVVMGKKRKGERKRQGLPTPTCRGGDKEGEKKDRNYQRPHL